MALSQITHSKDGSKEYKYPIVNLKGKYFDDGEEYDIIVLAQPTIQPGGPYGANYSFFGKFQLDPEQAYVFKISEGTYKYMMGLGVNKFDIVHVKGVTEKNEKTGISYLTVGIEVTKPKQYNGMVQPEGVKGGHMPVSSIVISGRGINTLSAKNNVFSGSQAVPGSNLQPSLVTMSKVGSAMQLPRKVASATNSSESSIALTVEDTLLRLGMEIVNEMVNSPELESYRKKWYDDMTDFRNTILYQDKMQGKSVSQDIFDKLHKEFKKSCL